MNAFFSNNSNNLAIQVLDDNPFYATFLEHQINRYVEKHFPDVSDRITVSSYNECDEYLAAIPANGSISLIDYYLGNGVVGVDLLDRIRERSPECRVIIMTTENNLEALADCLDTSVAGFVFKDENTISLCHPIFEREIQRKLEIL